MAATQSGTPVYVYNTNQLAREKGAGFQLARAGANIGEDKFVACASGNRPPPRARALRGADRQRDYTVRRTGARRVCMHVYVYMRAYAVAADSLPL